MPQANPTDLRARLAGIQTFPQLVAFLRDDIGWPIEREDFEDLTFEYTPEELGIDARNAAKIQEIRRLRPISPHQPWGIFFVKFEPKRLPVVALRRILSSVALKKRGSANAADRTAWRLDDLLFLSSYGEGDERQISFAHFAAPKDGDDLPTLKVLGWDNLDTPLHLDAVARALGQHLTWPADDADREAWRAKWRAAFTLGHREVIRTSKDLSLRLAELARAIHDRIVTALKVENDKGPLTKLMNAFRDALVHDLKPESFADMYAQTITYGLLSARITDPKRKTADDFAAHLRTSPFLRELMEHFLRVGGRRGKAGGPGIDFDELGVADVVELLDAAKVEAVVQDFGDRNRKEDPVIHFYEHFLAAYNKKLKVQRGVFYTPQPVVSYIVRSVHELLQTEFGLADGLADTTTWGQMIARHPGLKLPPLTDEPGETRTISPDEPFVQILDPATGTATFLVEVIDVIHLTLKAKWHQQGLGEEQQRGAWNRYVPDHLLPRVHAYELMMAPYAIAHMKVSLKLAETGYLFASDERARIYLTNALEPWRKQLRIPEFAALAHESAAVNEIKRSKCFAVVLGNPPYAKSSSNRSDDAEFLVAEYKSLVAGERNVQPLSDDYLKFLSFGSRQIRRSSRGVLGMVTNRGWLGGIIHRGVREVLLRDFENIFICDCHGDTNVGETPPAGRANENVFDIQQGVAISCLARAGRSERSVVVADNWGTREEKSRLLTIARTELARVTVAPERPLYLFEAQEAAGSTEYMTFRSLTSVFGSGRRQADQGVSYGNGIKSNRDFLLVAFERSVLAERMSMLADRSRSDARIREDLRLEDGPYWNTARERKKIEPSKAREFLTPITYRPFDNRWLWYQVDLIQIGRGGASRRLMRSLTRLRSNVALLSSRNSQKEEFTAAFCTRFVSEMKTAESTRASYCFPLLILDEADRDGPEKARAHLNLSPEFVQAISILQEGPAVDPQDIFAFVYAILYCPSYRLRYSRYLKLDFPRIPMPRESSLLRELSRLGRQLVSLHLLEASALQSVPKSYFGPSRPLVKRVVWSGGCVWLDSPVSGVNASAASVAAGFRAVEDAVWNFEIGGYQVCEKWLKDRKGRRLSDEDIEHYEKIVIAISETIRIMKEIDEVIEQHGGWPGAFQAAAGKVAMAGPGSVVLFRPRMVEPKTEERYVTCVPLVPLEVAAGAFREGQPALDGDEVEWAEVGAGHRLRSGMFVAQVVGKSMEPEIPDGAYCLFRAPVEGSRQGKTVLVGLRDAADPETEEKYTVKRYESEKGEVDGSWRHTGIKLMPANPDFQPIELEAGDEERLRVVAELVEVLRPPAEAMPAAGGGEGANEPEEPCRPAEPSRPAPRGKRYAWKDEEDYTLPLFSETEEPAEPRKISDVEPSEAMCAIRDLLESSEAREGLDRESAIRSVARALGFARTGKNIRDGIDSWLTAAARRAIVETHAGRLHLVTRAIGDYDRRLLKDQFLASLGGYAWTDRDEAIRAFARWMGYARTGATIDEIARSLIKGLLREGRLQGTVGQVRRVR